MELSNFENMILTLKAYYNNFNFDITDNFKLNTWYDVFKNLSDAQVLAMVQEYQRRNKFPPQSPYDLLEVIKVIKLSREKTPEEMFEKMMEIIRDNSMFENVLKEKPLVHRAYKQFKFQIDNLTVDSRVFVKKDWCKYYGDLLKEQIDEEVKGMVMLDYAKTKFITG